MTLWIRDLTCTYDIRSHALPHRLCHQCSGIVAFSQTHFLVYTYGQAGTTRSIYPLLSPGATWPLTPLGTKRTIGIEPPLPSSVWPASRRCCGSREGEWCIKSPYNGLVLIGRSHKQMLQSLALSQTYHSLKQKKKYCLLILNFPRN